MAEYNVVLLDRDGCEIVNDLIDGLPSAKDRARYLLSPDFATAIESDHVSLDTEKVEVRNLDGVCLWDAPFERFTPSLKR